MSICCFHKVFKGTTAFLAVSMILGTVFSSRALRAEETIVYLDPGHGGQDIGARGADGLQEKNVALALAKQLNQKLGPQYSVRLSRNDDYGLELFHRTETANSQKVALFISLHTGGAFNYSTSGFAVYYYLDSPGRVLPEDIADDMSADQTTGRIPWHNVQYRHAAESRMLSQFLQASLAGVAGSSGCRMIGAPLLELSAANMPAVLVEIGCLNNPAEEKKLSNPEHLDLLAKAIHSGIDSYLSRSSGITSIDLHE